MAKKNKPLIDRKVEALEEYLGIGFVDGDYPEYLENSYASIKQHGKRLDELEEKVNGKKAAAKKRLFG